MNGFIFAIVILPLTILLILFGFLTKNNLFYKLAIGFWILLFSLFLLGQIMETFGGKKKLKKDDIYGKYVIDRTKYSPKQANWQYNHYKFEITNDNDFLFYVTDTNRIVRKFQGKVHFLEAYKQPRIDIKLDEPKHHVIAENPTLYRQSNSFYYVFKSNKFGNMFFVKDNSQKN